MESLKKRLITSAIGIPLTIMVFILSERFHWIMFGIVSVLCLFMVFELLSANKLHKKLWLFIPCALYGVLQPILIVSKYGLLPAFLFTAVVFLAMILFNSEISYSDASFSILGTLIITWGLSSILIVPSAIKGYYSFFLVLALGIAWCSDTGAYFSGVYLGKHKLCPKVSPKKTVEGFVGGLISGTFSAVIIGLIYSCIYEGSEFNYILLFLCGFTGSLFSVLGDLTFSMIKRSSGIKDYGSIFPGHGGFLDRFDSVIFSAPLIYFFFLYADPLFVIK